MVAAEREFLNNFGKKLRAARIKRRLSQDAVARVTGVCLQSVGNCERGQNIPNVLSAFRLMLATGLSVREITEIVRNVPKYSEGRGSVPKTRELRSKNPELLRP